MPERAWIDIVKKMPALDQEIGTYRKLMMRRHGKQGAIVAHPEEPGRSRTREVAGDEIKLFIQEAARQG